MDYRLVFVTLLGQKFLVEGSFTPGIRATPSSPPEASTFIAHSVTLPGDGRDLFCFLSEETITALEDYALRSILSTTFNEEES